MNRELEGILEGSSHGIIKILFWNLPGQTEENHKNPQGNMRSSRDSNQTPPEQKSK
jgi:hypothetical protein